MMRMALGHFANDPLSAQEENVVYSMRHFTKPFPNVYYKQCLSPMVS